MQQENQRKKKNILKLVLFSNILFIILVACGDSIGTNPKITPHSPTPSATATCPVGVQLSTPDGWGTSTRLNIILYDARVKGNLELENGEVAQDIFSFVKKIVPVLMGPGDQIAIFQLGYSSYEAARITRLNSYEIIPQLYNTPAPRETLTPFPTTTATPVPGFLAVQATKISRVRATSIVSTQAANEAIYNCEVEYWNDNVKLTATAWAGTQVAEINSISTNIEDDYENFGIDGEETPYLTDELMYGGLYYGLNFATAVLNAECSKYDECIVLIIDDLDLWGKNNPDELVIDLNGARIYTIIPNCEDLNQPSCKKASNYWRSEFVKYGSDENIIYWNGTRVEINLLDILRR